MVVSKNGGGSGSPQTPRIESQKVERLPVSVFAHGNTVVTIKVGPAPRISDFLVHKNLIRAASSFFQAALQGHFFESTTNTVTLPDHDFHAFHVFYQYLYTRRVFDAPFFILSVLEDVLWLRTLKLANYTGVWPLRQAV